MSNDQDKPVGNMLDHVERYKQHIKNLKSGKSSGISAQFGKAADLLPEEALHVKNVPGAKPVAVGEELLSNFSANIARSTLEYLIEQVHADVEESGSVVTDGGEQEVIGVFFDGDRRMYMLEDMSVVPADEVRPRMQATPAPDPVSLAPKPETLPEPAPVSERDPEPAPVSEHDPEPAFNHAQQIALDVAQNTVQNAHHSPREAQVASAAEVVANTVSQVSQINDVQADLHICTANGKWLWDVYYDGAKVVTVETSEGVVIQRTDTGERYVITTPMPTSRFPKVEILEAMAIDPATGNIFWQAQNGIKAGALLNNGWQIEQYHREDDSDQFFVTEPLQPGLSERRRFQVYNLQLDPASGEVSYEMDNGAVVTLRSRRL